MRLLAHSRVREILASSPDPLSVLVAIAADEQNNVQLRMQAAAHAAPYMFPRLSAAVVATAPASSRDDTQQLVERLMQRFAKLAPPVQTIEGEAATCA